MKEYFEKNADVQLIHITISFDNIKSILTEGSFRLKYCKEEFCLRKRAISKRVHPMVCFTEQNIYQLQTKTITYGKYGIALSQKWILKNNIQPVMYIEQNSAVANSLANLLVYRRKLTKGHPLRLPIMTIACFTKNTIGYNSYLDKEGFLFKDENEWRYVPTKKQIKNGYISEDRSKFLNNQHEYNNRLLDYPLKFDIDTDIVCIYCADSNECQNLSSEYPNLRERIKVAPWKIN